MSTTAYPHSDSNSARALARVRAGLPMPAPARDRALRVMQQAVPVVARSVAAGMAVIALEQAVRRFVDGAAERVRPTVPVVAESRPYAATFSMTETVVIERVRRRR